MIRIRKATRDDIPALCALERECFSRPWVETSFEDFFSLDFTDALAAVDLSDGKVVGYAGLYRSMNEGDITNIAVTASMRRKGVGRALIEGLKSLDGIENLFLEVRISNSPAISLYEGQGFKRDGVRKNFYSNPREDAILMSYRKEG